MNSPTSRTNSLQWSWGPPFCPFITDMNRFSPTEALIYIQHTDHQPIYQRRPNHVCLFGKMKGLEFSCEWLHVWQQISTTCFFAELTVLSSPSLPSLIYFPGYFGDSNSELNIEYWSLWEVFKSRQIGFRRTHFNALVSRQLFQCITLFTIALHCSGTFPKFSASR